MSIILLIEKRLFLRNCLHDCFDRSYPEHEIFAFGSIAEWCNSVEKKTLKPAVVIYFAATGIGLMMKSEFERLEGLVPNTPIVVVSDTASSDEIARIIGYGARGYVPTSMPYHLAVEAVRFVEAGGTFVPAGNMLASRDRHRKPAGASALTERQMKVVEAVGRGFANKQIAYKLKMSENTVKVHLRHIMRKLKVRNRTEIAIMTRRLLDEAGELQPSGRAGKLQDRPSL
ncbi:two component transcriptional regulator, LuxR family [Bradyrhizobium lablabi]|uniref:Two component transcriptional regulator, LuxR family n=2 Tax=Bradyrhizobium lablabi TaxID=722472 RepID=A0A1M6XG90_9BRAD|nr:two component transcriptional regulator, LuxR family [Bradyrhizobium lablabi]